MAARGELLGESAGIAALRERVPGLARRQSGGVRPLAPILILGETGAGAGRLAGILLAGPLPGGGSGAAGPFVAVTARSSRETLLEAGACR